MNEISKVLIVDDEPIGRSAAQSLLLREGYQLELAPDGASALRMATESPPDLILLDVMMPGMDGFEVTRRMRSIPTLAEVPIILVTALDDPSSRLEGLDAGADEFISKPYDRIELRARVRSITRLNRFRRISVGREQYQRLFERSPIGLCVVGNDLTLIEVNSVAKTLFTRWLGATEQHSLDRIFNSDQLAQLQDTLLPKAAEQTSPTHAEFAVTLPSGLKIWVEITVTSIPSLSKAGYLIGLIDRTRERVLELELQQSQKLETIGQLAAGIAHDFNNLLTVINGFSTLALERLLPTDPSREAVEQVYKAGEKAATLTRQLLSFSRKESLNAVVFDPSLLLQNVDKMIRRLIGENISVHVITSSSGRIFADPSQFEQVLFNLVVNARDAMPNGGELTIEIRDVTDPPDESGVAPGRWVRLLVLDDGMGMNAEVQSRIFEPFFTTKGMGKGTGLGLATVLSVVKQNKGRINVWSDVGLGTQFEIDFPLLDDPGRCGDTSAIETRLIHGSETVLLAEDEDSVRTFAAAALTAAGYQVLEANDGETALEVSSRHAGPIHLLFTDALMQKLGGHGLAEKILARRPGIKILYTSGYDDETVFQFGIVSGRESFLKKPYVVYTLLKMVREVLDRETHQEPVLD